MGNPTYQGLAASFEKRNFNPFIVIRYKWNHDLARSSAVFFLGNTLLALNILKSKFHFESLHDKRARGN